MIIECVGRRMLLPAGSVPRVLTDLREVGLVSDVPLPEGPVWALTDTRRPRPHPVMSDVDFGIREHDFVGVAGPSGAGKTSLLRLLLGTVRPQHGTIHRRPGTTVG
jgi:ABC-type glutathione transport system ATPase component